MKSESQPGDVVVLPLGDGYRTYRRPKPKAEQAAPEPRDSSSYPEWSVCQVWLHGSTGKSGWHEGHIVDRKRGMDGRARFYRVKLRDANVIRRKPEQVREV